MTTSARRSVASITALIAVAVLSVGGAPAVWAHFDDSRVTLGVSDDTVKPNQTITFFGRLRNEHGPCRSGETVRLVRRNTGVVARDKTDSEGEFSFRIDPQPNQGRYFARYRGAGRFGYGDSHACGADSSAIVVIQPQ